MKNTLLDCSQRAELLGSVPLVAELEAGARRAGVELIISGAFARDLHLGAHGITASRRTDDIDFGVAVTRWSDFDRLKEELTGSGAFLPSDSVQRLKHRSTGLLVDLVPFGGVEEPSRHVSWPPKHEVRMNVFGFAEANASAVVVHLPKGVRTRVVSLAALAILKLMAWEERHSFAPKKDASDLMLIAREYLQCGGHERLSSEPLTDDPEFDYDTAGARLLGQDMRLLLDQAGTSRIIALLLREASEEAAGVLAAEMSPMEPDRARRLLRAMIKGLGGKADRPK